MDWWRSIGALQGQIWRGSEDQRRNKEMNVGYILSKSQTVLSLSEQEAETGNLQNLFVLWHFTFTVIRRIVLCFNFVTLVPRNNWHSWNTMKEVRVNSNKINQKQKMDLDEKQVEEVSTSGSPVLSAACMSRKKRVSQEICKKKKQSSIVTDRQPQPHWCNRFILPLLTKWRMHQIKQKNLVVIPHVFLMNAY